MTNVPFPVVGRGVILYRNETLKWAGAGGEKGVRGWLEWLGERAKGWLIWLRIHPECPPERVRFGGYLTFQTIQSAGLLVYKVRKVGDW